MNTNKENISKPGNIGNYIKTVLISTVMLYSSLTNAQIKDKYFIDSIDYKNKITNLLKGSDRDNLLRECDTIISKGNELILLRLHQKDTAKQKEIKDFFQKKLNDNYPYSRKLAGSDISEEEGGLDGYYMNGFIQNIAQKSVGVLSQEEEIQLEKDKIELSHLLSTYLEKREEDFINYIYPKLNGGASEGKHRLTMKDDLSAVYGLIYNGYGLPDETEEIRKGKNYRLPKEENIKSFIKKLRKAIRKEISIQNLLFDFENEVRGHKKTNLLLYFENFKNQIKKYGYFENNKH